jgi:hypothetical protein
MPEATTMTSQSQTSPLFAHPAARAANRTMQIAKVGIFAVSLAAAIPTARNLYYSWQNDIPFSEVSHRLDQYDLWMKNLDCRINYRTLSASGGTTIDVGTCQKSGDIAIKVSARGQSNYEWIAFDRLPKPASNTTSAGFMSLLISSAFADEMGADTVTRMSDGPLHVAQATIETVCQARAGQQIIRITKSGNKCYKEVVSPLKGTVESRTEVPCNAQCTPG